MNILANELRLGNYIELKFTDEVIQKSLGDKFSVEQINYHHIKDLCVNDESVIYKPIPLTEEWLLNFGFIKDEYQAKECGEDVGDLFSFKKIPSILAIHNKSRFTSKKPFNSSIMFFSFVISKNMVVK